MIRLSGAGVLTRDRFHAGDWVEVKSREEILATLDSKGCIDGMPFMPEMLRFCGQRFRVSMLAHKTCDTISYSGLRSLKRTVHLEGLRCDGAAHGGCEALCSLFWKIDWLKPVGAQAVSESRPGTGSGTALTEAELCAKAVQELPGGELRYVCQVTELPRATRPLSWWRPDHYIADIFSGNWRATHVLSVLALAVLRRTIKRLPAYRLQLAAYNWFARRTGRPSYSDIVDFRGPIPVGSPTPASSASFAAGDWVRIKPLKEISATLNVQGKNRGMFFDAELIPYCTGTFKVQRIVKRLIDEGTGRMMEMKNPCIALEGVVCRSEYADKRLMCPRSIVHMWRPVWLEKLDGSVAADTGSESRVDQTTPKDRSFPRACEV